MGIFDVFKTNEKTFGTLHCFDTREWANGYKTDTKGLVNFVKKQNKGKSNEEIFDLLAKRPGYRKFEDKNINESLNKISCVKYFNQYSKDIDVLPKIDFFIHPKNFVDDVYDKVFAFRILDSNFSIQNDKIIKSKTKFLVILKVENQPKPGIAKKDVNFDNKIRDLSFQYIVLDKLEYNLLKPYEKTFKNLKDEVYAKAWDKGEMYNTIFGEDGLFATEKRKKYPINYFQAYLAFEG